MTLLHSHCTTTVTAHAVFVLFCRHYLNKERYASTSPRYRQPSIQLNLKSSAPRDRPLSVYESSNNRYAKSVQHTKKNILIIQRKVKNLEIKFK